MNILIIGMGDFILSIWKGDEALVNFGKLVLVVAAMALVMILLFWLLGMGRRRRLRSLDHELPGEAAEQPHALVTKCREEVASTIITLAKNLYLVIDSLLKRDPDRLGKSMADIDELNARSKELKRSIPQAIRQLDEDSVESAVSYVQVLDYLREAAHCLTFIARPVHEHLEGEQASLLPDQAMELSKMNEDISEFYNFTLNLLTKGKYDQLGEIIRKQQQLMEEITVINRNQLKRVKKGEAGTRASILYLDILAETKNLLLHTVNILKSQRDFIHSRRTL